MGTFPNSPSVNDTTNIGSKTFKWTGYAWTQEVAGSSGSSGGASATGATYVYTSGGSLANASADGEFLHNTSNNTISINENDSNGTSFADALNGTLTTTGRIGVIFGDSTIERNFYYDSVTLFSGSYSFTATGILPNISTGSGKSVTINVYADAPAQAASEYFRFPDGTEAESIVTSFNGLTGDVTGVSSFNGETGAVTFDQLEIFAGAGMTLTGSTLGIDPTAVVEVAGISSDGGATFGGPIKTQFLTIDNADAKIASDTVTLLALNSSSHGLKIDSATARLMYAGSSSKSLEVGNGYGKSNQLFVTAAGISMDAAGITFPDGTFQSTAASGSGGVTGADGTSVGYTAGNTAPVGANTGDFWYENDTGLYYAYIFDGTTLGWIQISGIDGVTGPRGVTGQDGSGGGGGATYYGGAGLTLSGGNTFSIDPTAIVHVAGISSDGGITLDGKLSSPYGYINFVNTRTGIATHTGFEKIHVNNTEVKFLVPIELDSHNIVTQGISLGSSGITFADGTFQSSAASGSGVTAGAGMVLTGSTLGIDPTAVVHVAGVSSDGGITAGGEIRAVSDIVFNGGSRIQNDSSSRNSYIYFEDGNNGQIRFRPDNMPAFNITRAEGVIVNSAVRFRSEPIAEFLAGISMDAAGITFPDGTFQSSAASGSTITAGAGMTLAGSTLGIDPTATIHVAGISADGGITLGGNLQTTDNDFDILNADGNKVFDLTTRNVKIGDCDGTGNSTSILIRDSHNVITQTAATSITLNTVNVPINSKLSHNGDSDTYLDFSANNTINLTAGGVTLANLTTDGFAFPKGISLDTSGITFADGTFQSTAPTGSSTVTASYSGHLESAIVKTYYLDPRLPVERTVTEFYAICGTGGCSAEIGGLNGSISTISVSPTGVTGSLANTTLPVGGTLDMTLSNVSNCFDLRFAVRYTQ